MARKQRQLWRMLRLELLMSVFICAQLNFQEGKTNVDVNLNKRGCGTHGYCHAKGDTCCDTEVTVPGPADACPSVQFVKRHIPACLIDDGLYIIF